MRRADKNWAKVDFLLTPLPRPAPPSLLVHVVVEWPHGKKYENKNYPTQNWNSSFSFFLSCLYPFCPWPLSFWYQYQSRCHLHHYFSHPVGLKKIVKWQNLELNYVFWREEIARNFEGRKSIYCTHLIGFFIRIRFFEILGIGIFGLPFLFSFFSGFFFLFIRIFLLIGIFTRIFGIFGLPFPTSRCSFFFWAFDFFDIGIRISYNKI